MARMEDYTVVIRPDDNGTYVAYIPAIPGCYAWGNTLDEARNELLSTLQIQGEIGWKRTGYTSWNQPCQQDSKHVALPFIHQFLKRILPPNYG